MLQIGADDGSRRLRPERKGFVSPINESVHFLFHDVRGFPDSTLKEGRFFEQWNADLPETERLKNVTSRLFDISPLFRLRGKDVFESPDCRDDFHEQQPLQIFRFQAGLDNITSRQTQYK